MDVLSLHLTGYTYNVKYPWAYEEGTEQRIGITINGVDLLDEVRRVELPHAVAEGRPYLAGQYIGLPAEPGWTRLSYWLGTDEGDLEWNDKTPLYWCAGCGDGGCWPLVVRIVTTEDTVEWREFEQPHRTAEWTPIKWDYATLGPFIFDWRQYEAAIAVLQREVTDQ